MEHRRVASVEAMAAALRTLSGEDAQRVIYQNARLTHGVIVAIYRLTDHLTYGAKYERQSPEAQLETLRKGGNLPPNLRWSVPPDVSAMDGEGAFVSVHQDLEYHEEVERHVLPFCEAFKIRNRLTKDFKSKIIHSKFARNFDELTGVGARSLRAQMGEAYLGVSVDRMRKEVAQPFECGIGIRDAVDFIRANWGMLDRGSIGIACAADLVPDSNGEFTMVPVFGPHFGQLCLYAHPVTAADPRVGIATQFLPAHLR